MHWLVYSCVCISLCKTDLSSTNQINESIKENLQNNHDSNFFLLQYYYFMKEIKDVFFFELANASLGALEEMQYSNFRLGLALVSSRVLLKVSSVCTSLCKHGKHHFFLDNGKVISASLAKIRYTDTLSNWIKLDFYRFPNLSSR